MNSSARRIGVPVAAPNASKQESSSLLRASRITIALGDIPELRDNNATD
jgi:hypothetical protein